MKIHPLFLKHHRFRRSTQFYQGFGDINHKWIWSAYIEILHKIGDLVPQELFVDPAMLAAWVSLIGERIQEICSQHFCKLLSQDDIPIGPVRKYQDIPMDIIICV
jgi:hypothetical protein